MKKMYALLLAVILIVSMTACTTGGGDVKADLDKIQQASTKSTEQNALDAKVSMTMKMDADGETMEIPITMDMKMKALDTAPQMYITMNMEAEGEPIDIAYFNDEEYLYMEVMGIMMKCPMPEGYFNSENFMGNTAEDLANTSNLTEELVKSVKTESVDGGTKYTITFKEDQLSKILQDENGALSEFASLANTDLSGVTVDDIAESVSVNKDGYMTQLAMTFKMTVKSGSESGKMDVAMTLDVNNPGQDVTITLPDTSGAVEVTAEEMGLE